MLAASFPYTCFLLARIHKRKKRAYTIGVHNHLSCSSIHAYAGALAAANVAGEDIAGFAADTTCCSVCCLDAAGQPLRNALIWMDQRYMLHQHSAWVVDLERPSVSQMSIDQNTP